MRPIRWDWIARLPRWALASVLLAMTIAAIYGGFLLARGPLPDKPWLKVLGAGFIFNYRVSDVYSGFTALVQRPIPVGTVLRVSFEDPAGAPPHIVEQTLGLTDRRLSVRSPSLRGVKAGTDYRIAMALLGRGTGVTLWQDEIIVRSPIDDTVVPPQPLTIGPGYHRAPPAPTD